MMEGQTLKDRNPELSEEVLLEYIQSTNRENVEDNLFLLLNQCECVTITYIRDGSDIRMLTECYTKKNDKDRLRLEEVNRIDQPQKLHAKIAIHISAIFGRFLRDKHGIL